VRAVALFALIALTAEARGDASIGGREATPPPMPQPDRFTTRWPRVWSCKQIGSATVFGDQSTKVRWIGSSDALDFPEIPPRGWVELAPPKSAGGWTELVVERRSTSRSRPVNVHAFCADPRGRDLSWDCYRQGQCTAGARDWLASPVHAKLFDRGELALAEKLAALDEDGPRGRAAEFEGLGRALLADVQSLVAAACALGCTQAVDEHVQLARKLAAARLRFREVDGSGRAPELFDDVRARGVRFDSVEGEVAVLCGTGTYFPAKKRAHFCQLWYLDRPIASIQWDSDGPHYQVGLRSKRYGAVSVYSNGLISVSGAALDTR
jgi:hypothetical protein